MYRVLAFLLVCVLVGDVSAQGLSAETRKKAEDAYRQQDFETAFLALAEIPGLLGVVPLLDQPQDHTRAEFFFDLARIRLAQNDTARARSILAYIFALNPDAQRGILDIEEDHAFSETHTRLAQLRQQKRLQDLKSTTALGAAGRSLILPGWGQFYRGQRKRAFVFVGATLAATTYWFLADQAYKSAYNAYRSTRINELSIDQRSGLETDPLPFQQRFQTAQSKASRANMALGILAGVWLAGVFDHVLIGPGHLEVGFPIF
jgi:hypothetical protein